MVHQWYYKNTITYNYKAQKRTNFSEFFVLLNL